jgi:hypothetical protein
VVVIGPLQLLSTSTLETAIINTCMHISFHPPVDQTVPISVLPHASTVQLHFTATLNSQKAYDEFKRDGVRIQVWSDIPAGGREEGEWGELSFEEGISYKEDNSLSETVSLLSEDTDRGSKGHTLCLDCTVPLFGQSRFAYTYRLVYPDGDIRWLGQFGRNGTLILEYADLRITLGDGWRLEDEAARDYRWCNDGVPVDVEVARLDRKDYSVWCVGKERFVLFVIC